MTYKEPGHEQVALDLDGGEIEIDVGLAILLSKLWGNHIDTIESCQGSDSQKAYLCFPSRSDADLFLRVVFNDEINYWDDLIPGVCFVPKEGWMVKTYAEIDGEAVEADEAWAGCQRIVMIDFPASEIVELENMF